MINQIKIERFKSIESVLMELARINVLVGANNAGKSSILQALQFTTSVAQTAFLYSQTAKFGRDGVWATSVYPDQLIYSPVKDPYALAKGGILKEDVGTGISVTFSEDSGERVIATFRKGRNKNIAVRFEGEQVGKQLISLEKPFCMYVPGLAGISFEEEIRTVGVIRRIAAKGDSNMVFRNIINLLSHDREKWERFLIDLRTIFPTIEFSISERPNVDGMINVEFRMGEETSALPIDLAGTGILQAIQIAAYVNYFQPTLLLLDEPDSHLHPNNQRLLAALLVSLAERAATTIIISTHSRHLMAALRDDAKFFLMRHGMVSDSKYDHYIGLLELGALDEYDRIKNGELKYVFLTEDSTEKSIRCLRGLLNASGYCESEYKVYSYSGVNQIDSAKTFAKFLTDLNPTICVGIYRDRDGLSADEIEEKKKELNSCNRVKCIISYYNDIEMYYCNKEHIIQLCLMEGFSVTENEVETLIQDAFNEANEESRTKFLGHRLAIAQRKRQGLGDEANEAYQEYENNKALYLYGKKISGLIKAALQKKFGSNVDLFKYTDKLRTDEFKNLFDVEHLEN